MEIGACLEPSTRKDQADLMKSCLQRDNHQCLVTGAYDINAPSEILFKEIEEVKTAYTECAHLSLARHEQVIVHFKYINCGVQTHGAGSRQYPSGYKAF